MSVTHAWSGRVNLPNQDDPSPQVVSGRRPENADGLAPDSLPTGPPRRVSVCRKSTESPPSESDVIVARDRSALVGDSPANTRSS